MYFRIKFLLRQWENRIDINVEDYDNNPIIQDYFSNTKLTTKTMDNEDKLTVFNILKMSDSVIIDLNRVCIC